MIAICSDCKESREVKWKPKKGVVCLSCRKKGRQINPVGERTKYTRVCKCGDVATVGYKPRGTEMCRLCRGREQAKDMCGKNVKRDEDKKRYTHFCMMCPSIRVTVDGRKSNLCRDCSRKHARKKKTTIVFDFATMKMVGRPKKIYHSVCPSCKEPREVSQTNFSLHGGLTKCRSCATRDRTGKPSKVKVRRVVKAKDKKVSKEAIEKVIKLNREHREAQKTRESIPVAKLSEDEMTAIWLSKHSVTVVQDTVRLSDLGVGMKTGFCRAD